MAINRFLSPKTAADIDQRVDRILRGLGYPKPPLRLEQVRELLRLDRGFYTADDPNLAREVISRIRVAGIQLLQRPSLLKDVVAKMSLQALYIPDARRILLDGSLPVLKHRWNEAHEVAHSIIPWHTEMMHGDNQESLSRHCQEHVEAEANYGAGQLLFLRERFVREVRARPASLDTIRELKDLFGNTLTSTLYRFVETADDEKPLVGMITCHPHADRRPSNLAARDAIRHYIRSPAFATRFSRVQEAVLFEAVSGYCGSQRAGPLGECELVLADDRGQQQQFHFATFFNNYHALTLGVHIRAEPKIHAAAAC